MCRCKMGNLKKMSRFICLRCLKAFDEYKSKQTKPEKLNSKKVSWLPNSTVEEAFCCYFDCESCIM